MPIRRQKRWNETRRVLLGRVRNATARGGVILQTTMKIELSQPGTGRFYARGKRESIMAHREITRWDAEHAMKEEEAKFQKAFDKAERGLANYPKRKNLREIGIHRASAPGHPPAVDFGHLRRSMQLDASRLNEPNPRVRVGTNLKYAPPLEYGDPLHRLAPRPFMRPSARKARPKIKAEFDSRKLLAKIT